MALAICLAVAIFSAIRVVGDSNICQSWEATQRRSNTQIAKSKRLAIRAVVDQDPDNATLTLKWSLKNVSKEDIRLIESNVLRDYRILIVDRYGKPVPLTQEGERAFQVSFFSSRRLVVLRPGEELKREINLASLYDLKPSNVYIINLDRQIATQDASEQVRAGPIRVTLR